MKISLRALIAAAVMALVCVGAAQARRQGEKVGVTIDSALYDFGTIYDDDPNVHHTFIISNTGDDAVAILSASASCGCTKPKYQKKPLRAGESTAIDVTFIPSGQSGEINKDVKVRLKSASGKSETVNLRLKGVVLPKKARK